MVERVQVALGERSYDILIGEHLLAQAGKHIGEQVAGKNIIVVSDEQVARFYLHRLTGSLDEHKIRYRCVIVASGEASKSLGGFSTLAESLLEQKPDRGTVLVALGGGVVGDLAGFAASVLLRGVDYIQIPTTLLAQVDSSVGGKTGINSKYGKNLIGSFHQPKLVIADTATLATLPKRQWLCGYAEMLKYALINDAAFFAWLEEHAQAMLGGDNGLLQQAIATSCIAKSAIVSRDEKEHGPRALLNFGHTFGHALEAETGFGDALLHGEAVAIGMMLAFETSVAMGLCPKADLERLRAHYQAVGLHAAPLGTLAKCTADSLMTHFSHDKKTKGGALTFILTRGIGQGFVANNVDKSVIREVLAAALASV
jgi:3-dehydroquinate synthase